MMKRYIINGNAFWYEEGTQPANAIEADVKKVEIDAPAKVEVKIATPKNKSKGVKAK